MDQYCGDPVPAQFNGKIIVDFVFCKAYYEVQGENEANGSDILDARLLSAAVVLDLSRAGPFHEHCFLPYIRFDDSDRGNFLEIHHCRAFGNCASFGTWNNADS